MTDTLHTIQEAESFCNTFITPDSVIRKRNLTRIRLLMRALGNPQRTVRVIQVAGTAGKASTALFISALLEQQGIRVATYTKPHITRITERILIDRIPITDIDFIRYCNRLVPICETIKREHPTLIPTYTEILLALALKYFSDAQVACAVIEAGVGGAHDATSMLHPSVCVLTNVGLAHTALLGTTIRQIGKEKIGIMKSHVPFVTTLSQQTLQHELFAKAKKMCVPVHCYEKDFFAESVRTLQTRSVTKRGHQLFTYRSGQTIIPDIYLPHRGMHQVKNAALAIRAASLFIPITAGTIYQAFAHSVLTGKFEILTYRNKTLLLDGAHNTPKIRAFIQTVRELFPNNRFPVYFPTSKNPDLNNMLNQCGAVASQFIFVRTLSTDMVDQTFADIAKRTFPEIPFSFVDATDVPDHCLTQQSDKIIFVGAVKLVELVHTGAHIPYTLK